MPFAGTMGVVRFISIPFVHQFTSGYTPLTNVGITSPTRLEAVSLGTFFFAGQPKVGGQNTVISGTPGKITYTATISGTGTAFAAFYSGPNATGTQTVIVNITSGGSSGTITLPIGTSSASITVSAERNSLASIVIVIS